MRGRCSLTRTLRPLGRDFLAPTCISTLTSGPLVLLGATQRALDQAQKLAPHSPETLLALGYYQYRVLGDPGQAKTTFGLAGKMLPANSEVPCAIGEVA